MRRVCGGVRRRHTTEERRRESEQSRALRDCVVCAVCALYFGRGGTLAGRRLIGTSRDARRKDAGGGEDTRETRGGGGRGGPSECSHHRSMHGSAIDRRGRAPWLTIPRGPLLLHRARPQCSARWIVRVVYRCADETRACGWGAERSWKMHFKESFAMSDRPNERGRRNSRCKGAGVKMEQFQAALDPRKQELLEARFLGAKKVTDLQRAVNKCIEAGYPVIWLTLSALIACLQVSAGEILIETQRAHQFKTRAEKCVGAIGLGERRRASGPRGQRHRDTSAPLRRAALSHSKHTELKQCARLLHNNAYRH
ncbi:hypothetical protein RR46_15061 [Papilio xuthus]|uniref:Uncharacterized protein n=1 Tax=Papilio xuthus TaxID=66420 RepID=A0A194PE65_PAPXU|nr:hypothetical protein RR46_15061 [Papilio xuthus]